MKTKSYSFLVPGTLLTAGLLCFIYLTMVFAGTAPISPKSHSILAEMVEENSKLNTPYYQKLENQVYISQNDYEILMAHWFKLISHAKKESGKND